MDRLGAMAQFVRVVEAGSFSAAARILGLGQPAISKAIAQLEHRLGVRLFFRTTRALSLTDAGKIYYDRAKAALDAAEEAEAAAKGAGAALAGRLRVCAPVTLARIQIVPALRGFMTLHPGLELELILDDRRVNLVEEGIDVAIRAGALDDTSMVAQRLARSERRIVATPEFWAAHTEIRRPADLAALPFVSYGVERPDVEWNFSRKGETEKVRFSSRLKLSALEGVRAAIFAGMGFGVLSDWASRDALLSGRIERRLQGFALPAIDLWAVFPAGRQPAARARAFADHVGAIAKISGAGN